MMIEYYFTKGVDRLYPKRWYLSAHPDAQVIQYFERTDVCKIRDYLIKLGFKPAKTCSYITEYNFKSGKSRKNYEMRNLFIVFKNKSDEAHFLMAVASGFKIN